MVVKDLVSRRLVDRFAIARMQLPLALARDAGLPAIGRWCPPHNNHRTLLVVFY